MCPCTKDNKKRAANSDLLLINNAQTIRSVLESALLRGIIPFRASSCFRPSKSTTDVATCAQRMIRLPDATSFPSPLFSSHVCGILSLFLFTPRNRLNRRRVPRAGINPSSSRFLREQPSCCLGWKERMNPNRRKAYKQKKKERRRPIGSLQQRGIRQNSSRPKGGRRGDTLRSPPRKRKTD